MSIPEAVRLAEMREVYLQIGDEALAAGTARGYSIQPLFGLRPQDVEGSGLVLDKLLNKVAGDIRESDERNCILQDHLKGRYSEVDSINGLVVEASEGFGRAAPANAMVVQLSRQIFSGQLQPDRANLELARTVLTQ
jgi:2-dehydropantoate 2-reductase